MNLLSVSVYLWLCLCSYQGLICDQGIPDASHGLTNAQVGVKLVAVQTGHQLRKEWSQLLPGLCCDHVEPKSCSLNVGEIREVRGEQGRDKTRKREKEEYDTLREFHMAW